MRKGASLKTTAFAAGFAILMISLGLAGLSIWATGQFRGAVGELALASSALRHQGSADMMHDALRGDVYRALHDAGNGAEARREILAAAAEHARSFHEHVAKLADLDLSPKVKEEVVALAGPVDAYTRLGGATAAAAYEDAGRVASMLPTFDSRFADLEVTLEAVADAIQAEAEAIEAHAAAIMGTVGTAAWSAAFVALVFAAGLQILVRRRVVTPIVGAATVARAFAAGRYEVPVDTRVGAEIGDLMTALAGWREDALAKRAAEQAETERLALEAARQARLVRLVETFRGDVEMLLADVGRGMGRLGETSVQLDAIAAAAAERTSRIATGSEEASANVATVAGATEELTATIAGLADQIRSASETLRAVARSAEASNAQVGELADRADRIGAVVGLIRDVADQTNLLALNATIEAARAGEAGRGFAVVASEVKSLAGQTSNATREIAEQVEGIQASTRDAVGAIRDIAARLQEVDQVTSAIAAAITQQSAATGEIGRGITNAATGAGAVAANVGGVRGSVEETREATRVLAGVSSDVAERTARLRASVEQFLAGVAA